MKLDVVGFGALNIDKLYQVDHIAHEDGEAFIADFQESTGGSAANTITGLARLGLKTGYIGKVAEDREGSIILENFKEEGVNTEGVIIAPSGRSGTVQGFVDPNGQRALYVDPGVNDDLLISDVNLEYASNSRLIHLTSFVGGSIKSQEKLLEEIPPSVKVSLDPGMIYARYGSEYLEKILKRTDILLLNSTELGLLVPEVDRRDERIKQLLDYGIEIVVVKAGDQGCFVTNGDESHFLEAFTVNCLDTTGAGDAFNSGFIYALLEGKNIKESAFMGNLVASFCVQEHGATTGLPSKSALENISRTK